MSDRKARREIDKAIKHLIQYTGPNGEWEGLLDELKSEMFATPSRVLGWSIDELDDLINESPYQPMAFGFLFEEYATARWDDAPKSLAEAYLEHRGWREGTAGRAFLRALSESALRLWEVVEVTPGSHVDIRPYGTQEKPLRAYEQLGSESLKPWDVLAARLIKVNGKWGFTGGMLPLTPELAMRVQSTLDNVAGEIHDLFDKLVADGEIEEPPEDISANIKDVQNNQLAEVVFNIWVTDIYRHLEGPGPSLHNSEGDPFAPIEVKFPLADSPDSVAAQLDASPVFLREDPATKIWVWAPYNAVVADPNDSLLAQGFASLNDNYLTIEVNSERRADECKTAIGKLLGDSVREPLMVYDTMDLTDGNATAANDPPEITPEIQDALDAYQTQHYRQVLDEPIPMLDGLSPRQCAADPQHRQKVIGWLKHLENNGQKAPGPSYNFSWIWDELGLERS